MAIVQGPTIAKEEKTQEKEGGGIIMLRLRSRISFGNYLEIALEIIKPSYSFGTLFILFNVVNKFECKVKIVLPFTGNLDKRQYDNI